METYPLTAIELICLGVLIFWGGLKLFSGYVLRMLLGMTLVGAGVFYYLEFIKDGTLSHLEAVIVERPTNRTYLEVLATERQKHTNSKILFEANESVEGNSSQKSP